MKVYLLALAITIALGASAQHLEGTIIYDVSVKLKFGPSGSQSHGYTQAFELIYTDKASIYSHLPEALTETMNKVANETIIRPQNNSVTYFDFIAGNKIEQRELQDGIYIIKEPISNINWTLTTEEKTLLGHKVIKAYANRLDSSLRTTMENGVLKKETLVDSSRMEAWFAPGIPVPAGPGDIHGLPGLVLELRYDTDRKVFLAKEFIPKAPKSRLKVPSKGKHVTRVEFQKAMEKQVAASQKFMPGEELKVQRDN